MKTTILDGQEVVLTEGCYVAPGGKIAGIFASEQDARSSDADQRALGTIAWDKLTPHQQEVATANSESLL